MVRSITIVYAIGGQDKTKDKGSSVYVIIDTVWKRILGLSGSPGQASLIAGGKYGVAGAGCDRYEW